MGVGVSDLLKEINGGSSKDLSKVLIGDGMIIFAQIIVAAQMVIEEKFVNGKNIHPLRFARDNFPKILDSRCTVVMVQNYHCVMAELLTFGRIIDFS